MIRRNQLAILGASVLLGVGGVAAGATVSSGGGGDETPQNESTTTVDSTTTSTSTTVADTTTTDQGAPATTAAPPDPGPLEPEPDGSPLEDVVANHEARIGDLEDEPPVTAGPPPATEAPPTTVNRLAPTTTGEQVPSL